MIHDRKQPGRPLRIMASDYNAMIAATEKVRGGRAGSPSPDADLLARSTSLALVRNDTASTLARFSAVGLGSPIITPSANLAEFKSRLTFGATLPVAGTHEGKFGVLLEPLRAGKIGVAAVAGVVPVKITGTAGAAWAEITNASAVLTAGETGSARVLYQESGSSERWAYVRLAEESQSSGSSPTFAGVYVVKDATQSIASATTTTVSWPAENYDTDAYHDNSTNNSRLTVPSGLAGYYHVGVNIWWASSVTNDTLMTTRLVHSGGTILGEVRDVQSVAGSHTTYQFVSAAVLLSVGDYVEVQVVQTSGVNLNIQGPGGLNPAFWMYRVGV